MRNKSALKRTFLVTVEFKENKKELSKALVKAYIKESVSVWQGSYNPDENPLFGNIKNVVVQIL